MRPRDRIRVLVIDDSPFSRQAIARLREIAAQTSRDLGFCGQ